MPQPYKAEPSSGLPLKFQHFWVPNGQRASVHTQSIRPVHLASAADKTPHASQILSTGDVLSRTSHSTQQAPITAMHYEAVRKTST
mmetsp:Transcript_36143/g.58957  ORF Transcript_36143/g.58957 Transcript_36143/m.58957 type:complete len:86 (-) Transcript_36143:1713-1970(-)